MKRSPAYHAGMKRSDVYRDIVSNMRWNECQDRVLSGYVRSGVTVDVSFDYWPIDGQYLAKVEVSTVPNVSFSSTVRASGHVGIVRACAAFVVDALLIEKRILLDAMTSAVGRNSAATAKRNKRSN